MGPGICPLCWSNEESVDHLFSYCLVWKTVADFIVDYFHIKVCISGIPSADMFNGWVGKIPKSSPLFLLLFNMIWIVWKARNLAVFEGKKGIFMASSSKFCQLFRLHFMGLFPKKVGANKSKIHLSSLFPVVLLMVLQITGLLVLAFASSSMTLTSWSFHWGSDMALIPRWSFSASGHSCTSPI